ncbi:MAG TPA: hypothetical protein DCY13_23140 [Verrucomicrobiales bacterium]|nr:hypothetical protein [Verrucomicrobiales bacterium]
MKALAKRSIPYLVGIIWHIGSSGSLPAAEIDFLRDVRPILSGHCFKCHGPDAEQRKGGLQLDIREKALEGGKSGEAAIVERDPAASEMIRRILSEDEDEIMPPPATKHPLSPAQKEILRAWVAAGADYQPHWAFIKPERPQPPTVKNSEWPVNEIDHFVLGRLEAAGLRPQAKADKYSLIRRVYLDLVGLPPSPEQADTFVSDTSPDAYEKVVNGLLQSKHYGERWARRWLDLARYADTNGYEKDRPRSIWPYRDWVINAINAGKPFDDFSVEQLAGDLLARELPDGDPGKLELMIATGFHRNSMINEEGGTDPQEFRFYSMVDRVHVTATTWLGLTMACAQCHTHKYDPIQHSEYYQFMAFLNNADEPWIDVPKPDISERRQNQLAKIAETENALIHQFPPELKADWITPAETDFASESGTNSERQSDGSFLVAGPAADKDVYTVTLKTSLDGITHLQLLALPDQTLAKNGPGRSENGNFVLSEIEVSAAPLGDPDSAQPVKLAKARADAAQKDFPAWNAIDGKEDTGWAIDTGGDWHVSRTLTINFENPVSHEGGTTFTIKLKQQHGKQHLIGRFRLSLGRALPDERPLDIRRREHLDLRLAKWLDHELPRSIEWKPVAPIAAKGSYPTLTIEPDNIVFVSGDFTKSDTYTVEFDGDWKGVRAVRIEALADERLPNDGPGRVNYEGPFGDFFMSDIKVFHNDTAVKIKSATDSFRSGGNSAAKAIDDDLQSGWSINGGQGRNHSAVFVFEEPLNFAGRLRLQMIFERYYAAGLGKFRVWATRDEDPAAVPHPNDVQETLLAIRQGVSETERVRLMNRLREHYVTIAPELEEELAGLAKLKSRLPKYPTTLVMIERPEGHQRVTHIHKRGEFLQPTDPVEPGVPAVLPDLPADAPRNRLGFARWLVSPENPLTPRVVMNRHWQAFFGRGLVKTMEDFGFQGELPTHPDLLDWLATEFVRRDWSLKEMHKLIVMSATYQQSSGTTPELLERDPENLLLSRGPRFRLEAELIRDAGLVASGLISGKLGGPSVYPPQPANITTEGAYGRLDWALSEGEDRYRRGLYTFAKRTAPFAMFNAFDAPSGEACVARRDRSNTPLQSLTLLNDEMFLEMARALGREAAESAGTVEHRAADLFRRCITRPPTADELAKLVRFYEKQAARFGSGELKAADLMNSNTGDNLNEQAAWTTVARVLMNLDEAVTKS